MHTLTHMDTETKTLLLEILEELADGIESVGQGDHSDDDCRIMADTKKKIDALRRIL